MTNEEFRDYMNEFYGKNGLYPSGRDLTQEEVDAAISQINDFQGDSVDRERARDLIFTSTELEQMYSARVTKIF